MGLAKPSRSYASSLTCRTSRPIGISDNGGASLNFSGMATPLSARVMQTQQRHVPPELLAGSEIQFRARSNASSIERATVSACGVRSAQRS